MQYNEKILDHFYRPRYAGAFAPGEVGVVEGRAGARANGEVVQLQLKIGRAGSIEAARFKSYGSVVTIACGAWVSEWVTGKSVEVAAALGAADIIAALGVPAVKRHCALLAEDALKGALAAHKNTVLR